MNGLSGGWGRPQIRAQFPPPNGALGRFLYADGQLRPRGDATTEGAMQLGVGAEAQLSLEGSDIGDTGPKIHTPRLSLKRGHATQNLDIPKHGPGAEPLAMTKWPQHERLKAEILSYCEKNGTNYEGVAQELGVALPSLRNYAYGSKRPSVRFLQRAARLFGVSITAFVDDPAAQPDPEMDEMTRWMAQEMTGNLAKLPPAKRRAAFEIWKSTVEGLME